MSDLVLRRCKVQNYGVAVFKTSLNYMSRRSAKNQAIILGQTQQTIRCLGSIKI